MPRDLASGEAAAAGQEVVGAERGEEIVDLPQHDLQAVPVEAHVLDHLRVEQAHRVAGGGVAETGRELFRPRRAPDDVTALEDGDLQPPSSEVKSADQAVMPPAD